MASLNPRQSIERLLTEPLSVHGLSEADREEFGADSDKSHLAKVSSMLEVVGLPRATLAKYPHEFSGGQRQRIGIARAMILNPDLVIADEPVSALDVSVQAQVINLLEHLQDMLGLTYLVIAHDLAVVRHISDTIGVMYLGRLVEQAPSDDLYASPLHPYTIALMSAIPIPDPDVEDHRERILLKGDLPSPANPPSGCRFHTRCPFRQPTRCDTEEPVLRQIEGQPAESQGRLPLRRADPERRDRRPGSWSDHRTGDAMTSQPEAPETLFFDQYDTQVGVVGVLAGPAGVRRTGWRLSARGASIEPDEMVQIAIGQFREYFAGQRREFDLPLDWPRLEPVTEAVLRTLMGVGYGETVTYAELARRSGTGIPARAIGSIMAANPWPIVVPCHRVVASDGLGGYSGGEPGREIETKRWLLENEGALPATLI